jgi:2-dehydro-3-deoxyphosphogluconate aldolase/(4S)-4-hydroxy-2-oxoglutarate aldolase
MTAVQTKEDVCRRIREVGIVPAIRVATTDDAFFAAETVIAGGIPILEITMTVPNALEIVAGLRKRHPEAVIGAGTVLDTGVARQCLAAGAMFITSPGFDKGIVEAAREAQVAAIPGALTPTEVMGALRTGADMVKIYPCSQLGGPPCIKALRAPFPQVAFIASGGVNQQNAAQFIEAGASALGIREDLMPHAAIVGRKADWITELTHRFIGMVQRARAGR